jgi:hypothetical protein
VSISEEIRASAAAHRDLGPGYDTALAEGLVERIGDEIDRRVDARLYGQLRTPQAPPAPLAPPAPVLPPRAARSSGLGFPHVILALGSMGLAIGATSAALHPGANTPSSGALVALIWIVIGVINVAYARRR